MKATEQYFKFPVALFLMESADEFLKFDYSKESY